MAPVEIERLVVGAGARLRDLRLRALSDAPEAFASTLDEAAARPMEDWERALEELATFVAVSDTGDVGLVRGAPHDDLPNAVYLISMWVAPEGRRRGIARELIHHVVEWARARGGDRVLLDVGILNLGAMELYRRAGFGPTGEESFAEVSGRHIHDIQMVLWLELAPS
jgi:ribosomal protein S18 acetylase RimI-like enzyme